jgi:hypothetical protein
MRVPPFFHQRSFGCFVLSLGGHPVKKPEFQHVKKGVAQHFTHNLLRFFEDKERVGTLEVTVEGKSAFRRQTAQGQGVVEA